MKIAIYAGMYEKDSDGATRTLYELTDTLLNNRFDVGIWAFSITPQKRKRLHLFKIPSVPLPFYPAYKLSIPNPLLKKQVEEFEPDVLHITVPDLVGLSLMRLAQRLGIPVLTSFHTDFPSYLESYKLGFLYHSAWKYFRWFYNKSRSVLAPTEEVIGKLKNFGIQNTKLWSRGIHLEYFNPSFRSESLRRQWGVAPNETQPTKIILYSGRFVWYKDLQTFIDTYYLFKKNGPHNVKFVLAGDGPIREELERQMPDAVFTGYVTGETLSRVYASADLLLFPSTTETFGNVVQEALASGIPAVVSDVGGCKEIIRKSSAGLIAKAKDAKHFYMCTKRLLFDEKRYRQCKECGLEHAQNLSWQRINNHVIEEYYSISHNTPGTVTTEKLVNIYH
jgi:phosphatidylinositol alpha 1,6-mannosyltransferase